MGKGLKLLLGFGIAYALIAVMAMSIVHQRPKVRATEPGDRTGWVPMKPADPFRWQEMDSLKEEGKEDRAAARAWKLCLDHPDWAIVDCRTIGAKKVRVGLTMEQALAAWGTPERKHVSLTARGRHEQWAYEGGSYLYFEDGILTSIDQ